MNYLHQSNHIKWRLSEQQQFIIQEQQNRSYILLMKKSTPKRSEGKLVSKAEVTITQTGASVIVPPLNMTKVISGGSNNSIHPGTLGAPEQLQYNQIQKAKQAAGSPIDLIDTTNLQQKYSANKTQSNKPRGEKGGYGAANKSGAGITPARGVENGPLPSMQKYQSVNNQIQGSIIEKNKLSSEVRKKLINANKGSSTQSAAKALETSSLQKKHKVISILSDSERKQSRRNKPRGSIAFNLAGSTENQVANASAENGGGEGITTPGDESELAIIQHDMSKITSQNDLAFTTLAQERRNTAERRALSSTQPGRGGTHQARESRKAADDLEPNLVTIESKSSNKGSNQDNKDQKGVQILVADEDTDSNERPFYMSDQKSLIIDGIPQQHSKANKNMFQTYRTKQSSDAYNCQMTGSVYKTKQLTNSSSHQNLLPATRIIKQQQDSTTNNDKKTVSREPSYSNQPIIQNQDGKNTTQSQNPNRKSSGFIPFKQTKTLKPTNNLKMNKNNNLMQGQNKGMPKAMSFEQLEPFKPIQKSHSISGGSNADNKALMMRQGSRNNVYQSIGGAVEKCSTEDQFIYNQQLNNQNNFNVTDQKSIFSPQMLNSQVISEDPQYNNTSNKLQQTTSPPRPINNLEKKIQKFDEMIDQLKQQMLDGTITQHVYTKRYERYVKEKYLLKEEADQKERTKQYRKEKEREKQQRKSSHLPSYKKSTGALFSPPSHQSQKMYSLHQKPQSNTKKYSDKSKNEHQLLQRGVGCDSRGMNRLKSQEQLSRVTPVGTTLNNLSQPALLLQKLNKKSIVKQLQKTSTNESTKDRISSKSGTQNHKLLDSINLRSKEPTGSSLFKTIETVKCSENLTDQYRKGMNHLLLLSQDTQGLSQIQQYKNQMSHRSSILNQQPPQSLMEDLVSTNINFQIPDKENPAGHKRPLMTRQPGSSLPSKLKMIDQLGNAMIKNIQRRQGEIKVEDMDEAEMSQFETDQIKMQKVMKLGQETKKANQYLDKFVTLQAEYNKSRGLIDNGEYVSDKKQINFPHLLNQDMSNYTDSFVMRGGESNGFMNQNAQKILKNQVKNFRKTQSFSSFENKLQTITQKADKTGNINLKILDLIASPEMAKFADYPKTAIRAQQTEVKTLMYELKRCMNRQALIQTLESTSTTTDLVKNENIELISRLPIQFKVSIRERVAPLRLRFDFYDTQTKKKLVNPDTVVCISPTKDCPTLDTAQITKTDFKDPYVVLYRDMQGKVIPEFHPQNKKERFPQQVYLSLQSMTGCFCTITVSFPFEKKVLSKYNSKSMQQKRKQAGTQNQMSKQEEYFQEFQEIDKDPAIKNSYRETYRLKTKFIKEEIQRCTDSSSYVPEVMKRAEERKDINKKIRKERIEELKTQREEDAKEILNHFLVRQRTLRSATNSTGSVDDLLSNSRSQRILAFHNNQAMSSASNETVPLNQADILEHQKFKRELKMTQAKELRRIHYEEKQKRRMLFVVKQDLVAAYKREQFSKTEEQLRMNKLASCWAKRILVWKVIKTVFQNYDAMYKSIKEEQKMKASAEFLVMMARRYYRNATGQWGKDVKQRIQTKISYALLLPYYIKRDTAEAISKLRFVKFMESMACRNNFADRILKVTKSVKLLEKCWIGYKFKFIAVQILMKEKMRHQMQEWQKMAHIAVGKKLIIKEEKQEIMMSSQKLQENEQILHKNLILFSKMIRYETIIREIYARIETESNRATRILRKIALEEKEERELMGHSETSMNTHTNSDAQSTQQNQNSDEEESKSTGRGGNSYQRNNKNVVTKTLSIQDKKREDRKNRKRDAERTLKKMAKWRRSGFLRKIEEQQDKVIKEAIQLDSDPYNYSIFCWKGTECYDELRKNAIQHRQKSKTLKDKKDSKALIKQQKQKFGKQQAAVVRAYFKKWVSKRQEDFMKKLTDHLSRLETEELEQSVKDHVVFKEAMTGSDICPGRVTQPEELAFMFMKVMDEISKASKKTKKISKQQTSISRKLDTNTNNQNTMGTINTQ